MFESHDVANVGIVDGVHMFANTLDDVLVYVNFFAEMHLRRARLVSTPYLLQDTSWDRIIVSTLAQC